MFQHSNIHAKAKLYAFGSGDDHPGNGDAVLQPVVSAESRDRLLRLIADAKEKGARVIVGDEDFEVNLYLKGEWFDSSAK